MVELAVKRTFALLVLAALMYVLRERPAAVPIGASTAMALGFLLLAAHIGGQVAKVAGLSRVTGYILLGLVVGPGALGLLSGVQVRELRFLNDVAIALIALTAGGELRLARLRGAGRYMLSVTLAEMTAVFTLVAGTVLALSSFLPFTAGRDLALVVTIAMVFGSIAIANSPSVAIAVITDTKSEGPVSTTVLGVTVIKDVLVIVAFAVALTVAHTVLTPGRSFELDFALTLAWEIGGSLVVGAAIGAGVAAWLRWVRAHMVLFTLGVAWLIVELAGALHLEVLLLALVAGFTLENLLPVEGTEFVEALEAASLPIYALFFSLAGASVHLEALVTLWVWVVLLVAVRTAAIYLGTRAGATLGGAPEPVRRYAWFGFISQAGVTLGMVTIVARSFPTWGEELRALFVAMVAVHEIVGPIALSWALRRAGETQKARPAGRARSPATAGVEA